MSKNVVILFHQIHSKDWFRRTLMSIQKYYSIIPIMDVDAYYHKGNKFNRSCHITFDDGHRTLYENAFPVLKELNIPATVFVSPRIIKDGSNYWFQEMSHIRSQLDNKTILEMIFSELDINNEKLNDFMFGSLLKSMKLKDIMKVIHAIKEEHEVSCDVQFNLDNQQLTELIGSKLVTIGAHTMNHPILKNEDNSTAENEMKKSIEELFVLTGENVKYFAYPNGTPGLDYGEREKEILRENGILLAFSTDPNSFSNKTDPYSIPRIGIRMSKRKSEIMLLNKLYFPKIWQAVRGIASRAVTEKKEREEINKIFRS